MVLGVVLSCCPLNTAVFGRLKHFFLGNWAFSGFVAVIFSETSRRSSPVDGYWFQKHQPSRSTTLTKRGRDVRWNPDALLQIDKRGAHPKKHVLFDKNKKSSGIFFYTSTSRTFCCRPLRIAPVRLLCKVIGDWPLRAAGGIGTCTTHTCSECVLVGAKAKPPIFARKRDSYFPKAEHTCNWNVRRTKASLRHWKRENWNIFQNIWKKSNTPQGSIFLEWTISFKYCNPLLSSYFGSVHFFRKEKVRRFSTEKISVARKGARQPWANSCIRQPWA